MASKTQRHTRLGAITIQEDEEFMLPNTQVPLPVEIWERILSFIKLSYAFMPAATCKFFYAYLVKKLIISGNTKWPTNIQPYCERVESARFIVKMRGIDTIKDFRALCKLIYTTASNNCYYETYIYASFISANHEFDFSELLAKKKYDFIMKLFRDGLRLDNLTKSPSTAASLIIKSKNIQLIEAMIKYDPTTRYYITIEHAIELCNKEIFDTIIAAITNENGLVEVSQAYIHRYGLDLPVTSGPSSMTVADCISTYMEYIHLHNKYACSQSESKIKSQISFMCDTNGYVYTTTDPTNYAWEKKLFEVLKELIIRRCPVTDGLANILSVSMPDIYYQLLCSGGAGTNNMVGFAEDPAKNNTRHIHNSLIKWLDEVPNTNTDFFKTIHKKYSAVLSVTFSTYAFSRWYNALLKWQRYYYKWQKWTAKQNCISHKSLRNPKDDKQFVRYLDKKYEYASLMADAKRILDASSVWKTVHLTYLIENKCPILSEIADYLRINDPKLYAKIDPTTIVASEQDYSIVMPSNLSLRDRIKPHNKRYNDPDFSESEPEPEQQWNCHELFSND